MICPGGRGLEPHRGQRFFLFLHVGPFPFQGYRSEGIARDIYTALILNTSKNQYTLLKVICLTDLCFMLRVHKMLQSAALKMYIGPQPKVTFAFLAHERQHWEI